MNDQPTMQEVIRIVRAYEPSDVEDAKRFVKFLRLMADVISYV